MQFIFARSFTILIILWIIRGQVIKPLLVYKNLIEDIYNHFNNSCIWLLHADSNPIEAQGLKGAVLLRNLYMHFSNKKRIRTVIMSIEIFSKRVSLWIDMAHPTWLIFLDNKTTINDFFSGLYVPFNCKFMVSQSNEEGEVITEIYQVEPNAELRNTTFGTWNPETGIKTPELDFYLRRNNLFGKTLRIAFIEDPPLTHIIHNEEGQPTRLEGFIGAMLEILQTSMNFTPTYKEADEWGIPRENNSRNGLIGMLVKQEVDLTASALIMSQIRKTLIDYTIPLSTRRHRVYIKRPSPAIVKWKGYIAPFQQDVWSSIVLLIVITSIAIVFIQSMGRNISILRGENWKQLTRRIVKTSFTVLGAFCYQGMEETTSMDLVKVVHFIVYLTAIVVSSSYAAALISFLAVQSYSMPFTTLNGLLQDGTYKLGVVINSSEHVIFANTTDETLMAIYENLMEPRDLLPRTYQQGLKRLCNEDRYAFMIDDIFVEHYSPKDCILEPLRDAIQLNFALGVPKKSPYLGIINSNILRIIDSGILQRIMTYNSVEISKNKREWISVTIGDVVPLLVLLLGGIAIGCFLLCSEWFWYRRSKGFFKIRASH